MQGARFRDKRSVLIAHRAYGCTTRQLRSPHSIGGVRLRETGLISGRFLVASDEPSLLASAMTKAS